MINYANFYKYLCELVELYKTTKSLKGMSEIARKYGVKAITKEQFFQFKLNEGTPTRGYSDAIRRDLSTLDRLRHGGNDVSKQKAESVFGETLPGGYSGIKELPAVEGSPYRYALCPDPAIDNASEYMVSRKAQRSDVFDAVLKQINAINNSNDGIDEYLEFSVPTLCCAEWLQEYTIAFVKVYNNGTCYWLSEDKDILRLLAWIAFIAE